MGGFSRKLDLLKIGEKFRFDDMLEIRRSCAASRFDLWPCMRFKGKHACGSINGYVIYEARTHRDLWPRWTVEISVVTMWLAHITFLVNFRDNLGKWCRTFGRLDTNFSMCKPNSLSSLRSYFRIGWYVVHSTGHTLHIIARIIFRSFSNDLLYVATTKQIISTMRNFTLQIKIIMSHGCVAYVWDLSGYDWSVVRIKERQRWMANKVLLWKRGS